MIKFGIVKIADAARLGPAGLRSRRVAVPVLEEVGASPTPLEERLIENIVRQFPAGDFNFLNTFSGRYKSIDPQVAEEIKTRFSGQKSIRVHDMAVSNGITSLELFNYLQDIEGLKFIATDLYNEAYVVGPIRGGWRVIFDSKQMPAQFVGNRMVISAFRRERRRYPVNGLLQYLLKRLVLPTAKRMLSTSAQGGAGPVRMLKLVHPRCARKALDDPRFDLGKHDILERANPPSDVVRLMSVVTSLPGEMLPPIFRAAGQSVVEGGILILGIRDRTDPERAPTTIFLRKGARQFPVRDITGEYYYKQMVMDAALDG